MNFDIPAVRRGTNSEKWNSASIESIAANPDAEPFWVADMDFLPDPEIQNAGKALAELGIYAYPSFGKSVEEAASAWCKKKHGWDVGSDDLTFTMGMLHGIASAIDIFTEKGDKILVPSPMYRPFRDIPINLERTLVEHNLGYSNNTFFLDRERFSKAMDGVKCIIFCSPQNPSGIVFSKDDLTFVLEEAKKRDILVISDEIHSDLVHDGEKHIPMGMANESVGADCITYFAPSKTFNIAGEHCAFAHFSNKEREKAFRTRESAMRLSGISITIGELARVAYERGYEYNAELCTYLTESAKLMREYLEKNTELRMVNGGASFVTFIDCSAIYDKVAKKEKENPERYEGGKGGGVLSRFFGVEAGVAMNDGTWFGDDWKEFVRFNYGTSRKNVMAALERMKSAIDTL